METTGRPPGGHTRCHLAPWYEFLDNIGPLVELGGIHHLSHLINRFRLSFFQGDSDSLGEYVMSLGVGFKPVATGLKRAQLNRSASAFTVHWWNRSDSYRAGSRLDGQPGGHYRQATDGVPHDHDEKAFPELWSSGAAQ